MDSFSRRRATSLGWVGELPDPFSMRDVLARVDAGDIPAALSWLYAAIERGRVAPVGLGPVSRYRFVGGRRREDDRARTTGRPGRIARV
ncbi:MAG: hypothetical protein ACXVFN_16000 [Solirubrobacteraceae bacterium]